MSTLFRSLAVVMLLLGGFTACGLEEPDGAPDAPVEARESAEPRVDDEPSVAPEPSPTQDEVEESAGPDSEPEPDTEPDSDSVPAVRGTALAALGTLAVKGRAPMTGYARDMFGPAWMDTDRNGCDTRNDVLAAYLTEISRESNNCVVTSGVLADPYTATSIDFYRGHGALVDIDHVVALGNSWATGSSAWSMQQRAAFANDPVNLLPVAASANRQKGDGDAATWLPSNREFRCAYVARQVTVKQKYALWVTRPEAAAIERVLATCPDEPLAEDTAQLPTATDQKVREPVRTSKPKSKPKPVRTQTPAPAPPAAVYYKNCTAARDAGAAPVYVGQPGYGKHLDRDGDGIGCE